MKNQIKIRKVWGFSPVTRVKQSKKKYNRAQEKRNWLDS